jgi:transposase
MPRTRGPYPLEFRREAVELVLAGRSVRDVAESLGCSDQSLHNWVKLDQRERDDGLTSAEREELRELRKRVKRVEQEREILKRAAVLFAAETETR